MLRGSRCLAIVKDLCYQDFRLPAPNLYDE
jgi:hypothetical protein